VRAGAARLPLTAMLVLMLTGAAPLSAAVGLSGLAFRPHPGARLPLDLHLRDEHGRAVFLGQFFAGKPVIVVLEYLHCKTLCGLALGALATALDALPLDAGRDFQVVAVSIDPRDSPGDAAAAKAKYLAVYDHAGGGAGWHFLTGPQAAVKQIAGTIGFPFRYDAAIDQYMHPVGFVVAAANGTISRYLLEIDPTPAELRAGLADAAQAKAVGPLTRLLLWCHGDDPQIGRYTVPIEAAFAVADLAAMAGGIAVFAAIWRRRHG
jgi:protein SCO1